MPIPSILQKKGGGGRDAYLYSARNYSAKPGSRGLESAGCYHTPLFFDSLFPDLRIGLGNYFVQHDPGRDPPLEDESALWLQIVLKGTLFYRLGDAGEQRSMEEGQFNLFSLPSLSEINWFDTRNSHTQTLDIYFSPRMLHRPSVEFPALADMLKLREMGVMTMLSPCPMQVGPAMMRVILDIQQCGYEGNLRRVYMQTKVLEMLVLLLERMRQGRAEKSSRIHLKKSDIECIRQSRDWLMQQMENPPTLKELAHHAGINDFKLKKGYKQVFGITVFGDFHKERMEKARKYLLETEMPLMEVALLSGYQDSSNFSRAFKAYFGFTAGELRKHA